MVYVYIVGDRWKSSIKASSSSTKSDPDQQTMLTKQFPKNAQRKPGHENAQNTLLSPRLVMSPSVMGSRGMFSANKRKAVDILREAIQRESAGEVESALSLCEDAILVFPDATIGVNLSFYQYICI